jgi:hypothetical protein
MSRPEYTTPYTRPVEFSGVDFLIRKSREGPAILEAKHIHTAGNFKKSKLPLGDALVVTFETFGVAMTSRLNFLRLMTSTANTRKAKAPADLKAVCHEKAIAMGTIMAGASAHPRLPVMPCVLYACPSRASLGPETKSVEDHTGPPRSPTRFVSRKTP